MIKLSTTVIRAMDSVLDRMVGGAPVLEFYDGEAPDNLDEPVNGAKLSLRDMTNGEMRWLDTRPGPEPPRPPGATCWRIYDAGGRCVMQGDWS